MDKVEGAGLINLCQRSNPPDKSFSVLTLELNILEHLAVITENCAKNVKALILRLLDSNGFLKGSCIVQEHQYVLDSNGVLVIV